MNDLILFEDKDIIVCHKPAGLPVQSARLGQMDLVSMLNNHLQAQTVHVVHRLDQPVEGVVVFAKNKRAASELGRQITEGSMKKQYQAVCCVESGSWRTSFGDNGAQEPWHVLVDELVKDSRTNSSCVAKNGQKGAKRAELRFRALDERDGLLLVQIDLKTGRHHQIRVQMAHAGLPLYGDRKYNKNRERYGSGNLALCAVSLTFRHPSSGKELQFQVKPSSEVFFGFPPV